MAHRLYASLLLAALAQVAVGAGTEDNDAPFGAAVDHDRLVNWEQDPGQWMTYGLNYEEQRYSLLDRINQDNIGELGLLWYADIDTSRGQEATPLIVDGALYISTAWSMVKAFDIRSPCGAMTRRLTAPRVRTPAAMW